jgi:Domain of unknown function (DUF4388)
MSLTGHLDVFPLEEVLRLLSRSYKSGCLRIDTPEQHGRVYLESGSLSFATITTDDDFRRQLAASGLVSDDGLRTIEVSGRSLTEVLTPGTGSHQFTDLVREEVVESLYRIRKPGRGQFVFNLDVAPRYRMDQSFDVELCVSEADRRAADWADIELVIPHIDVELQINGEAPNGEPVTLAPNTWRLVAGFGGTATVRGLSERLGVSRFRVAKDLAGLIRAGLVEPVRPEVIEPAPVVVESVPFEVPTEVASPYTPAAEVIREADVPLPSWRSEADTTEIGAPASIPAHDRSWWEEPIERSVPAAALSVEPEAPEPEAEENQPTMLSDSFLDRVFSQLGENPEGQTAEPAEPKEEQGSLGHGFLKRRRMSSIGLDDV